MTTKQITYLNGMSITFVINDANEHLQRHWNAGTFYEAGMLEFIRQRWADRDEHKIFVDAGACIGNHSLFFSCIMHRIVAAIEPNPASAEILERNRHENYNQGARHIRLSRCALGDKPGIKHLVNDHDGNIGMWHISDKGNNQVQVHTLDEIIAGFDVAAIKIDVEGYNIPVLRGAAETLRTQHPELYIECATLDELHETEQELQQYGYIRHERVFNATPTYLFY